MWTTIQLCHPTSIPSPRINFTWSGPRWGHTLSFWNLTKMLGQHVASHRDCCLVRSQQGPLHQLTYQHRVSSLLAMQPLGRWHYSNASILPNSPSPANAIIARPDHRIGRTIHPKDHRRPCVNMLTVGFFARGWNRDNLRISRWAGIAKGLAKGHRSVIAVKLVGSSIIHFATRSSCLLLTRSSGRQVLAL